LYFVTSINAFYGTLVIYLAYIFVKPNFYFSPYIVREAENTSVTRASVCI